MSEMIREAADAGQAKRFPRKLQIAIGLALVVLLLAVSFGIVVWVLTRKLTAVSTPSSGDLAALLFGASSLALVIFSLLIAGLAIIGWQTLKTDVRKEIEESVSKRIISLEKELQGRVLAAFGVIQGRFYLQSEKHALTMEEQLDREDALNEIVEHCRMAYAILSTIEGNGKYMALNNFLYFSTLQRSKGTSDYILGKARELKKIGEEKRYWEGLLTCCRVFETFGETADDLKKALTQARELEANDALSERQKREAKSYVASLEKRLEQLGKAGS